MRSIASLTQVPATSDPVQLAEQLGRVVAAIEELQKTADQLRILLNHRLLHPQHPPQETTP